MRMMKKTLISAAALLALASPLAAQSAPEDPPPGQLWVREMLSEDPACDPDSAAELAAASRRGIEREVYRREDSIRPPTAAAELSCLGDLMSAAQLDVAWPTQRLTGGLPGFLQGVLAQALGSSGMSLGSLDLSALAAGAPDPTRLLSPSLCRLAEQRWNQASLPVLSGFSRLGPFAALPAARPLRGLLGGGAPPVQPARVFGLGGG